MRAPENPCVLDPGDVPAQFASLRHHFGQYVALVGVARALVEAWKSTLAILKVDSVELLAKYSKAATLVWNVPRSVHPDEDTNMGLFAAYRLAAPYTGPTAEIAPGVVAQGLGARVFLPPSFFGYDRDWGTELRLALAHGDARDAFASVVAQRTGRSP